MNYWPQIRPSGDRAVLIEFENRIDPEINRQVRSLALTIEEERIAGIEEILPAYRTLMLTYDPLILEHRALRDKLREWMDKAKTIHLPPGRIFTLPTVYGGEHGPDLQHVSEMTGLPVAEVVRIFSETKFLVYFIGFICGLAYLGGLPEVLRVPRLNTPRTLVPGGSVGLAGGQANAISTDQPSGFNYIGRTFVSLYNPKIFPPIPFIAGDEVRFVSVSEEEARIAQGKQATDFV
jgi:KipI family sensor histidine kinase inhibitor